MLFGTLCGISPEPSAVALTDAQPLLELQGRLLSSLLAVELRAVREERAADEAPHGFAGQVLDRSRCQVLLQGEQDRCAPHATPASVIALEVDDARARSSNAQVLAQRLLLDCRRPGDALARTRPGSYAVLCPETLEAVAETIATDLVLRLHDAGVPASCGVAGTDLRDRDLAAAWQRAEQLRRADRGAAGEADVPAPDCAERSGCGPACR